MNYSALRENLLGSPAENVRLLFVYKELGVPEVRAHRLNLIDQLQERVDEIAVVAGSFGPKKKRQVRDRLEEMGVDHEKESALGELEDQSPKDSPLSLLGVGENTPREFHQLLDKYEPNVVHVGSSEIAPVVAEHCHARAVPTVLSLHGDQIRLADRALMYNLEPLGPQGFPSSVICPTVRWKLRIREGWAGALTSFIPPERVYVAPPALDDDRYGPPSREQVKESRENFDIESEFAIFALGPVSDPARFEVLMQAVSQVKQKVGDVALLFAPDFLCGGPDRASQFLEVADQHGLKKKLVLATADRDQAAYWAADAAVLPSAANVPGVYLSRFMLCGVPPIRTKCGGGARTQIQNSESGFVVAQDGVQQLATRLTQLAKSKSLRRAMGRRAAEQARARHPRSEVASAVAEVYRSILSWDGKQGGFDDPVGPGSVVDLDSEVVVDAL